MVRIRSAEDGHSSIQQGAGNQRCSQITGADKNILKTMAPYTTGAGSTAALHTYLLTYLLTYYDNDDDDDDNAGGDGAAAETRDD